MNELDNAILNPRVDPSRCYLVVAENVYHQQPGEAPGATDSRFIRWLRSKEQLYNRRFEVGEQWTPLDCGWLPTAGMLVLANLPARYIVQPSPEELAEDAERVLEVAFAPNRPKNRDMHSPPIPAAEPVIVVLPGETARFQPAAASAVMIRCRKGTTKCALTLFPE